MSNVEDDALIVVCSGCGREWMRSKNATGAGREDFVAGEKTSPSPPEEPVRFPTLHLYVGLLKFLAWAVAVVATFTGMVVSSSAKSPGPFFQLLLLGGLSWLGLMVVAELLRLLLAIEENTRRSARALEAQGPAREDG